MLPDTDVIGLSFGIKYESVWGHRGFSYSFVFSILLRGVITFLDILTIGELGVAF